jgi:RNA polymerase sigma-70 factor (ECF subfamily)
LSEKSTDKKLRTKGGKSLDSSPSGDLLRGLVSRAQGGDVDAFQGLYEIFSQKIFNYLFRMTGSREESEDLAQDTFIQAYKKLSSLRDPLKIQSWLFRIAQNNVFQKYRGRQPVVESIDAHDLTEWSELRQLTTPQKEPEAEALSIELEGVIARAISQLPDKYRTVFVLSAIQRISYQEISEIVNRSLASVKSDIHRARIVVRDKVKEYLREKH